MNRFKHTMIQLESVYNASFFARRRERNCVRILMCLFGYFSIASTFGATYVLSNHANTVGKARYVSPEIGETLADVGYRYDIGLNEMRKANPQVPPNQILSPKIRVLIPSQFHLPSGPHQGIVINLAEFRLYYFPPDENIVITYPVGIGREGWNTPLGITQVVAKQKNPVWRPTANLRNEAEKNGLPLPEYFPASAYNPLGKHALRLGWPEILIHGSRTANGIGTRVSAGCIRMRAEDIEYLYDFIKVGTVVRVINQPQNDKG